MKDCTYYPSHKVHPCTLWMMLNKSGTTFNSEYPATLRSVQIACACSSLQQLRVLAERYTQFKKYFFNGE